METWNIRNESEIESVVDVVLRTLKKGSGACILSLSGNLGAGKTAFTKALAKKMGITETITSPTFTIMKSYALPSHPFLETLTHIDAYRIDDVQEMIVLGFDEMVKDSTQLLCIEWPERIQPLLPSDVYVLTFSLHKDGTRTITYEY